MHTNAYALLDRANWRLHRPHLIGPDCVPGDELEPVDPTHDTPWCVVCGL